MNAGSSLVERGAELAALDAALGRAARGAGGTVVLHGTAGIGKSSLLAAAAGRAENSGMHVLSATASRLEYDFPFGVARQLLERELLRRHGAGYQQLVSGPALLGAQTLAEHEHENVTTDPSSGPVHGLYWLIANLSAERPVLLVVDDLQWCDTASMAFLAYLSRRLIDLPVLLIAARRPDPHPGDPAAFAELTESPSRTVLRPAPLTVAGVRDLLDQLQVTCSPDDAQRLRLETGGNPFLVGELARSDSTGERRPDQPWPAPDTVSRSIRARVRDIGPDAARLAGAVVALGDGCVLAEAAAVAGLEQNDAAVAAAALIRSDVLGPAEGLRFAHPLVRTAIEDDLTGVETSNWHATAARVLAGRGADHDRIAIQLVNTAPSHDRDVANALLEAGRTALERGAAPAAERYLQRALLEGAGGIDLGQALTDLGSSQLLTDQFAAAAATLRRARNLSRGDAELLQRTTALSRAFVGIGPDAIAEKVELLESTILRLADREAQLTLESEFVNVALLDASRMSGTWDRLARIPVISGRTPAERRLLSVSTVRSQYAVGETAEDVGAAALRAYGDGSLISENPLDPTKWFWAVGTLILTDHLDEAELALHQGARSAAETGSLSTLLIVGDLRSLLWLRRGRMADALAEAQDAQAHLGDTVRTPVRRSIEIAMVRWSVLAHAAIGQLDAADALLEAHGLAGLLPAGPRPIRLHHERGVLRLAQRRPREALDEALALANFHRSHGIDSVVEAPWRTVAAVASSALHDTTAALEFADDHLRLSRVWGLPRDVGSALRTRARVETDLDRRLDLLTQAHALHATSPAPLELAQTSVALGASLRRAARRTEARDVLAQAADLSERCGAGALTERARDELRLVGGVPRVRAVAGIDALTPAERRIALLAADGQSNRQIAQELFLSVRTAENTLRRVYQKLGIASRQDLAGVLD